MTDIAVRKIFHILAPRASKTLCGAVATRHDIRFSWQSISVGDYDCCPECVAIRQESKESFTNSASVRTFTLGRKTPTQG